MSTTNGFPRHYEAIYHGDDGLEHAGVLSMTADGKLAIVSVDDRFADTIDTIVRNMNAMPHETVRVPPAPLAVFASVAGDSTFQRRVHPDDAGQYSARLSPEVAAWEHALTRTRFWINGLA